MADKFINQLPVAGAIAGAELVPIMQGGVTKQATASSLLSQPTQGAIVLLIIAGSVVANTSVIAGRVQMLNSGGIFLITSADDSGSDARFTCTGFGGGGSGAQMNLGGSLAVSLGFAANGNTPQTKAAVNAAAIDPATTMALVNQLRAALIANGICV